MQHRLLQSKTAALNSLDESVNRANRNKVDHILADRTKINLIGLMVVLVIAAVVMFPSLGATRLWDEDEGFYASTAAEMFERLDWIVPHFNGAMFGHKPPWMYWMMMLGYSVFGVGELGSRIPSAIFGCLGVLVTFQLGKLLFNLRVGVIGAIILATSIMFSVAGRSATPDGFLVCFTVTSLYLFCRAFLSTEPEKTAKLPLNSLVTIYAVLGLGMLTKGPIAVVFPVFIMATTCLLNQFNACPRKSTGSKILRVFQQPCGHPTNWFKACWNLRPITGALILVLVAGPWYLAVGWQTDWAFHREFFGVHHFQRATSSMEGHSGSLAYYPVSVLLGMYPWTVATGPVLIFWLRSLYSCPPAEFRQASLGSNSGSTETRNNANASSSVNIGVDSFSSSQINPRFRGAQSTRLGIQLLSIWAVIYLLIFSLAETKLPNYVLPAYPAFALIFAFGFDSWLISPNSFSMVWHRGSLGVLIFVGAILAMAIPIMAWVSVGGSTVFDRLDLAPAVQRELAWLGILGLPALLGGSIALVLAERKKCQSAFVVFCTMAIATVTCLWNFTAPKLDKLQGPQNLISEIRRDSNLQAVDIATFDFFRPSMVFYSGSPIQKCYTVEQVVSFFSERPKGVLVVDSSRLKELTPTLPAAFQVVHRSVRFPEEGELVAICCQHNRSELNVSENLKTEK